MGKRGRQVAEGERDQAAIMHLVDGFQVLARLGEQVPGGDKVGVRAAGQAE